jgi:hypothetical protein
LLKELFMSQNPNLQHNSPDESELLRLARLHDHARLQAEYLRREAIAAWRERCFAGVSSILRRLAFWR